MPKKRKPPKSKADSMVDIFEILTKSAEKAKKKRREELLAPLGVNEFFEEGNVSIDKRTCKGVECKLCIKACPTNALFWRAGEVDIIEDLCVYCGACVLSCIVDDCIRVARKRANGAVESFSKPKDFTLLQHSISARRRCDGILDIYHHPKKYLKPDK